mgnify:CR=1 FL=1
MIPKARLVKSAAMEVVTGEKPLPKEYASGKINNKVVSLEIPLNDYAAIELFAERNKFYNLQSFFRSVINNL